MEVVNTKTDPYKSILYKPYYEKGHAKENSSPNAATITSAELQRIRHSAATTGIEEAIAASKQTLVAYFDKPVDKKTTKSRAEILAEINELKAITSQVDEEQKAREREIAREKSEQAKTLELDEVKQIQKLAANAQVAAIRDQQLNEKRGLLKANVEEIKRLDLMMEVERVRGLKEEADKEAVRAREARAGREVISEQIKLNHMRRLKEKEEASEEAAELLRRTKALQQEDLQKADERKRAIAKTQEEIVQENEKAIVKKKLVVEQERAENAKIAKYLKEKAEKEEAMAKEAIRIRNEKELEVARLREKQEKEQDILTELDQLRAKRAQQERERAMQEAEARQAAEVLKRNAELKQARDTQAQEKVKKLFEQAKSDKLEFDKIIEAQKKAREIESRAEKESSLVRKRHAMTLKEQIILREEEELQKRRDKTEEGLKLKRAHSEIKERILKEKKEKINMLVQKNIPAKYRADLERKKL